MSSHCLRQHPTHPELTSWYREQQSWNGAFWALGWRSYIAHPSSSAWLYVCYIELNREGLIVYSWTGAGLLHTDRPRGRVYGVQLIRETDLVILIEAVSIRE